jgi:hypothetical protein
MTAKKELATAIQLRGAARDFAFTQRDHAGSVAIVNADRRLKRAAIAYARAANKVKP